MGRRKGGRGGDGDSQPRRGKRRSIRYEAEESWPEDRLEERRLDAPPEIMLRKLGLQEALERLEAQVTAYARQGREEVLVVHGKGQNSPGGRSVLGPEVRTWCENHPRLVSSWSEAPRKWGGSGAIVVELNTKKKG